ncbi:hypothetical protein CDO35_14355 [Pseudomonas sediminis]|uniref:O-antigen polysaccharide polymerase Wzy n=2 Tax=Pseudomonas sediminis TaxID=1691904 RepID=A0A2G5FJU8_9PSED|nr:hypothetical protein CDO35_14355 [Pseudomonas sediminis]
MRWEVLVKAVWLVVFTMIALIGGCALVEYQGSVWVYLLFTALSTALLFFGFGRGAIFFDAFIGALLWIGFWLKFSVRIAFMNGAFMVPVGAFEGTPQSLDQALLVASCAFAALLLVRFARAQLFCYPQDLAQVAFSGLFALYLRFRWLALASFILLVLFVGVSNAWFGIYQRGMVARTQLPFGLNGVYTWLLTFGLAAFAAVLLRFEFERNRDQLWLVATLALAESFVSNVSLMSRGMILNAGALIYGGAALFQRVEAKLRAGLLLYVGVLFCALFVGSVFLVNSARLNVFYGYSNEAQGEQKQAALNQYTAALFIDRWVGIEGVMSVIDKPELGSELFEQALAERFDPTVTSFYDKNFINSYHSNTGEDGRHFISLPGYIAFLFYPGSYLFLFAAVAVFSIFAAALEYLTYRFAGRNMVLCALIAQVVAYRFTSFGYVPMQSYKLFGTIALTILMLYVADKLCGLLFRRTVA